MDTVGGTRFRPGASEFRVADPLEVESDAGWAVGADGRIVAVDAATTARAGRAQLRREIAGLERALGQWECAPLMARLGVPVAGPAAGAPTLLSTGTLRTIRDELSTRLAARRDVHTAELARRGEARDRLRAMYLEPQRHRGAVVTNDDVGVDECTRWRVAPRLGVVGRFLGWWQLKVSSGCPRPSTGRPARVSRTGTTGRTA